MIAVAIVSYNPCFQTLIKLVNVLLNSDSVEVIYILDNNSDKCILSDISSSIFSEKLCLVSLPENKGIAFAQNFAISDVFNNRKSISEILFFDQDSCIDNSFIDNIYNDFKLIQNKNKNIAALGPKFIDKKNNFYFPALKLNRFGLIDKLDVVNIDDSIEVSCLISSGTLISINALKKIGFMKNEFFIDYVDTEWCFRAISMGYKIFISKNAIMEHSIGDDTIRFLGFNIPVHSGFRRYYRIRNLFFMWKMPYIPKILTIKLMLSNFVHQILLILIKDKKNEYIKYYLKAIRDGLKQSKDYHV